MKILINALSVKKGGAFTYILELLKGFSKSRNSYEFYVLVAQYNKKDFFKSFNGGKIKIIETPVSNLPFRLFYEQFIIPIIVVKKNVDVLYCPAEILTFFAPCAKILGVQNAYLYYDLAFKISFRAQVWIGALRFISRFSFKYSDKIISVSNTLTKQLLNRMKISNDKIKTVHHGININKFMNCDSMQDNTILLDYGLKGCDKYILTIGTEKPHKNIRVVIRAYTMLDYEILKKYKLLVIGVNENIALDVFEDINFDKFLNKKIIFAGNVPYKRIPIFYRNSSLFIFPSKLESFGLPLLEAIASGVPVVASNSTAIPEVLEKAGMLFDPDDSRELAKEIEMVLKNEDLKKGLVRKGKERVKNFSWEKTARKTLSVLEEVYYDKKH